MISKLKHRVKLCSQKDVVTDGGDLKLNRVNVVETWAGIEAKKASEFTVHGAATKETRNRRTHIVMMRLRFDINIADTAWLYEIRLKSSPRWFKVLAVEEVEKKATQFWKLEVRLVERSDDIVEPKEHGQHEVARPLPDGVNL